MDSDMLKYLDGFAGVAALVNSLILWPMYRTLKKLVMDSHEPRITALEQRAPRPRKRTKGRR